MSWDLGPRRGEWRRWIQHELDENGSDQRAVANEIRRRTGTTSGKTTAVNNFIAGDQDAVRGWFDRHPEWVDALEVEMGVDPGELRLRFDAMLHGEVAKVRWHEAFPEVEQEQAEIPAALDGSLGGDPASVTAAIATRVSALTRPTLTLIAPASRSRDIAVEQLTLALAERFPEATPTVEVAEHPSLRPLHVVRLRPWGTAELGRLATRLSQVDVLPRAHRAALTEFGRRCDARLSEGALTLSPDLAIRLLAEVARTDGKVDVAALRSLVTAGAWRRASARSARLSDLGERLMERYFARLAARERDPDETGGWTVVRRSVAEEELRAAVESEYGESAGLPLRALVDRALDSRGKASVEAIKALRAQLAADPIQSLVEDLVAGAVLRVEPRPAGERVAPRDPQLAAMWAARGLGGRFVFPDIGVALCDPDQGRLLEEQARLGAACSALRRALAEVPEPWCLDGAVALLRFALASPKLVDAPVEAWASVLWAVGHAFLETRTWAPWGWCARAEPVLQRFTHRYRAVLPRIGPDPIAEVRALVPLHVQRIIAQWRPTPAIGVSLEPARDDILFEPLRDQGRLVSRMIEAAPAVFVLDRPERLAQWERLPVGAVDRLVEEAERGDGECVAMLSGAAVVQAPDAATQEAAWQFWRDLPRDLRVTWAGRAGAEGEVGLRLLLELIQDENNDSRLLSVAERVGVDTMTAACGWALRSRDDSLRPRTLTLALAFEVAERLRMIELLEGVAEAPFEHAENWIPTLRDGWLMFGSESAQMEGDHFPKVPLESWLSAVDRRAGEAAERLCRMGYPQALQRRWQEPGPRLRPDALLSCLRIEGILDLARAHLGEWREQEVPLEVLGRYAEQPVRQQSAFGVERTFGPLRAWHAAEELGPDLPEVWARALKGLRVILCELPEDFSGELDAAFGRAPRQRLHMGTHRPADDAGRRAAAATALLLAGDDAPIHAWALERERSDEAREAAYQAVNRLIGEGNLGVIERCWRVALRSDSLISDGPEADTRRHLLARGSASSSSDPADPANFVVQYALSRADDYDLDGLTNRNGHRPAWIPVIRAGLAAAGTPRTRAHWAGWLALHTPDAPEFATAVDDWMHNDPDPWSGGEDWRLEGSTYVGGARRLLDAALVRPDTTAGLVRLFRLALDLHREPRRGLERPLERVRLHPRGAEAPWPIDVLAEAICARGEVGVVLEAWRDGATEEVKGWLQPWWVSAAPAGELRSTLWGPRFHRDVAYELSRRGELQRSDADRMLDLASPPWDLIEALAPDLLGSALDRRTGLPWRTESAEYAERMDAVGAHSASAGVRAWIAGRGTD